MSFDGVLPLFYGLSMNRAVIVLYTTAALGGCATAAQVPDRTVSAAEVSPEEAVAGEVLVKFRPATTKERVDELSQEIGLELLRYFDSLDIYHFRVSGGRPTHEVIQRLLQLPEVEFAEPNLRRKLNGQRC